MTYTPLAHSDEQVRQWVAEYLFRQTNITVAVSGGQIVGMMALNGTKSPDGLTNSISSHMSLDKALVLNSSNRLKPPSGLQSGCILFKPIKGRADSTNGMDSKPLNSAMVHRTKSNALMCCMNGGMNTES